MGGEFLDAGTQYGPDLSWLSGDFRYLDSDRTGRLKFVSLPEKLRVPPEMGISPDICSTTPEPAGRLFPRARPFVFRVHREAGSKHQGMASSGAFCVANYISFLMYVSDAREGLLRLGRRKLAPVPGFTERKKQFVDSRRLVLMPYGRGHRDSGGRPHTRQSARPFRIAPLSLRWSEARACSTA